MGVSQSALSVAGSRFQSLDNSPLIVLFIKTNYDADSRGISSMPPFLCFSCLLPLSGRLSVSVRVAERRSIYRPFSCPAVFVRRYHPLITHLSGAATSFWMDFGHCDRVVSSMFCLHLFRLGELLILGKAANTD